jgi:hypothetical protein
MMTFVYLTIAALIVAAIYFGIKYFVRVSRVFGGERIIICPETGKQAAVEVDVRRAAITSLLGQTDLRLESCWRWPLQQDCGQECLLQLDVASADCIVRSVLEKWYRDKKCAFCDRQFEDVQFIDHKPALLNPEGVTVEWRQVPISAVPEALRSYQPVCWNCHIARSFKRSHPDLVVERPPVIGQAARASHP